ncbi:hypothetical protein, partial [Rummeliibacillus suwonensis]|uniref:hypothetical protein n=1 Tax=Rummeliibacillus suwonensis TaxID=1306154 RepID=UPI0028996579
VITIHLPLRFVQLDTVLYIIMWQLNQSGHLPLHNYFIIISYLFSNYLPLKRSILHVNIYQLYHVKNILLRLFFPIYVNTK